jgi:hypothetical protein
MVSLDLENNTRAPINSRVDKWGEKAAGSSFSHYVAGRRVSRYHIQLFLQRFKVSDIMCYKIVKS